MTEPRRFREMGRIIRPHGVVGEMKVAPETDDPDRFHSLETVHVGVDETSTTSFDIVSVRMQPSKHGITVLLGLSGISDRAGAQSMAKQRVFALESDLPPLEEGEYYLSDLVGLSVHLMEGDSSGDEPIGTVVDVRETPGQDLLVIKKETGGQVMVPIVDEFVVAVDIEAGRLDLDPIEGLI